MRQGLTEEERKTMTLDDLRQTRLEALLDGEPVTRYLPRPGATGDRVATTSPTLDHLAAATEITMSSIRGYWAGRTTPRMTLPEMIRFAGCLGLTVEELGALAANTAKARAESRFQG